VCHIKCYQLVRSFTWTVVDNSASSQLDGHVYHAQMLLSMVLHHPDLCTELYCQLIKQTSKHPPQQKSTGMQVNSRHARHVFQILCDYQCLSVSLLTYEHYRYF